VPRMGTNGSTMLEPLRQGPPPLDPAAVAQAASCALPARLEAVREARRFTHRTLEQWRIPERTEDATLVVSELVTNALRHARTENGRESIVQLSALRRGAELVCAVRDGSDRLPQQKEAGFMAESGRGLHLVSCFSRTWGAVRTAVGGKFVWALFC
jgi:anti-sigma regulatory factor (Ser/Thr protein kinase)